MTKIVPLKDQVLIKRKSEDTVTKGGLFIPGSAQSKPSEGEVLAVGTGKVLENGTTVPPSVKPGDRVLFAQHAGVEVKVDDQEFLLLREDHIMGIFE